MPPKRPFRLYIDDMDISPPSKQSTLPLNLTAEMSDEEYRQHLLANIEHLPNNANNDLIERMVKCRRQPATKEGISFLRCRQVHIMEPYWNKSRLEQIIGRAVRFCSHKDLPAEERNVRVYIYMATHPDEKETIDQYIVKLAKNKDRLISEFSTALKEAAIDCELFKNANVYSGEEDIKCEK